MLFTFAKSMMWLLLDGDLQQLRTSAMTSSLPLFFAWDGLGPPCLCAVDLGGCDALSRRCLCFPCVLE